MRHHRLFACQGSGRVQHISRVPKDKMLNVLRASRLATHQLRHGCTWAHLVHWAKKAGFPQEVDIGPPVPTGPDWSPHEQGLIAFSVDRPRLPRFSSFHSLNSAPRLFVAGRVRFTHPLIQIYCGCPITQP